MAEQRKPRALATKTAGKVPKMVRANLAATLSAKEEGKKVAYAYIQDAPANYQKYCSGCHGSRLEKFAAKSWMEEKGTSSAFRSIKFGIETIGMPAFQKTFTDIEIEELAAYVKKGIPADRSTLKAAVTPGGVGTTGPANPAKRLR